MLQRRWILNASAGALLAGAVGAPVAAWAQVQDVNDAINKAGRQRMLSQRMAKAWLMLAHQADAFNQYLAGYIRGADGKPIKYVAPEPTVEAQRQIELNTLDRKYADKLSNIELEMAKAKAIEDGELYTELKEEREALVIEYAGKRGAI